MLDNVYVYTQGVFNDRKSREFNLSSEEKTLIFNKDNEKSMLMDKTVFSNIMTLLEKQGLEEEFNRIFE